MFNFGRFSVDDRRQRIKKYAFSWESVLVVVGALVLRSTLKNISITPADVNNVRNSGIPLHSINYVLRRRIICIFLLDQLNLGHCISRQDIPESLPMEMPQTICWHSRKFLLTKQKSIGYGKSNFFVHFRHYVQRFFARGFQQTLNSNHHEVGTKTSPCTPSR